MGIDVYFCKQQAGEIEQDGEGERLANVDGFLATVYTFGLALDPIRQLAESPTEEMRELVPPAAAAFEDYLDRNRARGLARFEEYYTLMLNAIEIQKAEGMVSLFGPSLVEQLPREAIEEDAQAFFGWFMLSERAIEPDEAEVVAPMLGLARGVLNHFAGQYEEENPDLAAMMRDAYEVLGTAAEFCDKSVQTSRPFYFSA